jgi:flagellar motor protein MotB
MKHGLQKLGVVVCVAGLAGMLTGCPPQVTDITRPMTEEYVQEAQQDLETAESLEAHEAYPDEFQQAKSAYATAVENLTEGQLNLAYEAARQSIRASRQIFRRIYLENVALLAKRAKTEIQHAKTQVQHAKVNDPDNPLEEFLPKLDEMLDLAQALQDNPKMAVDRKVVTNDLGQAAKISHIARTFIGDELESDISFERGQYTLSERGKDLVQRLARQMLTIISKNVHLYAERGVTIKIKAVGYTDQVPFRENTKLFQTLIEGVEAQLPQDAIERRKFLNQRLATLRAQTISDYFKQLIEAASQELPRIYFEEDIVGRGEDVPPGLSVVYSTADPVDDPQRRICKFYSYIII